MVTTVSMQIAIVSIRFLPGFHSFHAWAAIFDGHLYPPVEKPSAAPAPPIQSWLSGLSFPVPPNIGMGRGGRTRTSFFHRGGG